MPKTIQWGILGTGWIASQFTKDLAFAENGVAAAVGSRTLESASRFAADYGIGKAYGSYEELANDPDIEAIYVATPHPAHKENVLLCLKAGKAVLCEKPFTVNAGELEEAVSYAKENKVFLMEGMWTRFLPVIRKVREWLDEGRIGDVQLVKADFGFRAGVNPEGRLFNPSLGGGALLDAGIYPVSFASMIFGAEPEEVSSTAQIGSTGVDEQFSLLLSYGPGKTAQLNGAICLNMDNEACIYGTEGYIRIPSFLNATRAALYVNGNEEIFEDDRTSLGYAFEAEEVAKCLAEGRTESSVIPLEESVAIMKLLDRIRGQWGLRYPFE